jgi:hypothetical protein
MDILIEIIGYVGMLLCLSAYGLNVKGIINAESSYYLLANGVGGAFLVLNSIWHWALPSAFENGVWASIALWGLVNRKKIIKNKT